MDEYLESVVQQSVYRKELHIPDEVILHPAIREIVLAATDIIAFCNYNMEQMRGDDGHNIVTVVMHEHGTDVNGAMLWVENFLLGAQERFHAAKAALPDWDEPLNSQVQEYCDGVGQFVRANDDWSFEGERYFGKKGLEIKKNRWMLLLPKRHAKEIGPILPCTLSHFKL
ncbi:hypothetical protein JVU11DRAFT_10432 [Chiua virens]|nr:hypothetical protein JVU11DRAFT_10432 [Chiua virens]